MKQRHTKGLQLGDRPRYRFWQALYMAFYSVQLYVDVARRWRGLGLSYLLLLIACAVAPLSVRLIVVFNHYTNEQFIRPVRELPPVFIRQGEVSFDKKMPYLIKNKEEEVVGIVDTTGQTKGINSAYYPMLTWVLTKNTLYFRPPPLYLFSSLPVKPFSNPVTTIGLDPEENMVFWGGAWFDATYLNAMKILALCAVFPSLVLFVFMFLAGILLALAWLGQFFARIIFKVRLSYSAASRLVMVALTPPVLCCFWLLAADKFILGGAYLYIALLAVYFNFAVLMFKRSSNQIAIA